MTPGDAANRIINGYHETNDLIPLAGGIPQPIEQSDDDAVVLARNYWPREAELERLRRVIVRCHREACTAENCVLDGGPEHETAFPPQPPEPRR